MENKKVIDFLVKSGLWVKDNKIKASDLGKASVLIKQALAEVMAQKHFKMSVDMPHTIDVKSEVYPENDAFAAHISVRVNAGSSLNNADWVIVDTCNFDAEEDAINYAKKKVKNFKIRED